MHVAIHNGRRRDNPSNRAWNQLPPGVKLTRSSSFTSDVMRQHNEIGER